MINVSSKEYANKTPLYLIEKETEKEIYGDLFTQPFMLSINDKIVPESKYEAMTINELDKIVLIPLYAGG